MVNGPPRSAHHHRTKNSSGIAPEIIPRISASVNGKWIEIFLADISPVRGGIQHWIGKKNIETNIKKPYYL